jgi:hypothetical protein
MTEGGERREKMREERGETRDERVKDLALWEMWPAKNRNLV